MQRFQRRVIHQMYSQTKTAVVRMQRRLHIKNKILSNPYHHTMRSSPASNPSNSSAWSEWRSSSAGIPSSYRVQAAPLHQPVSPPSPATPPPQSRPPSHSPSHSPSPPLYRPLPYHQLVYNPAVAEFRANLLRKQQKCDQRECTECTPIIERPPPVQHDTSPVQQQPSRVRIYSVSHPEQSQTETTRHSVVDPGCWVGCVLGFLGGLLCGVAGLVGA
jgi:hypothetical protein